MFLSLLLYYTPIEVCQRILDLFFIEQEKILFKVLIRAVLICKNEILENSELDVKLNIVYDNQTLSKFLHEELLELCYHKCKNKLHLLFPGPESSE
jgi:hypothetical protein